MPKPNTTLILTLTTILLIPGLCFAGIEFDGVDDYIGLGNPNSLKLSSLFTISAWIKNDGTNNDWEDVTTHGDYGFILCLRSSGRITFGKQHSSAGQIHSNDNTLGNGEWRHIVGVFDGTYKIIYIDGAEDKKVINTGTMSTGQDVWLGGCSFAGEYFGGQLAEIAIWDVALSASDIATLAGARGNDLALQVQPGNLVGYWAMNEGQDGSSADGDTITDSSGTGNHGVGVDGANDSGLTWQGVSGVRIKGGVRVGPHY